MHHQNLPKLFFFVIIILIILGLTTSQTLAFDENECLAMCLDSPDPNCFSSCISGGGSTAFNSDNFANLLRSITNFILTPVVSFLVSIALVVFLWGVLKYMGKTGDEAEREKARQLIIWGIIGIFVMVSVWGLVKVLMGSFDWNTANPPTPINTLSQ